MVGNNHGEFGFGPPNCITGRIIDKVCLLRWNLRHLLASGVTDGIESFDFLSSGHSFSVCGPSQPDLFPEFSLHIISS